MTLPPPPANGFSAKENPGALIGLKALRYDPQGPDPFGKSDNGFAETTYLDVWVLADSREVGAFYSNVPNSSRLGRQFKSSVDGQVYYGRITSEKVGAGTSYVLGEPYASDAPIIAAHKAQLVGQQAPSHAAPQQPHQYQNEPAWQQNVPPQQPAPAAAPQSTYVPPQQPPAQPAYAPPQGPPPPQAPYQPPAQPAYQPQGYGAPAAPPVPPADADRPPY